MVNKQLLAQVLITSLICLVGCSHQTLDSAETVIAETDSELSQKVIYGEDGRMEAHRAPASLQPLARATVALMKSSDFRTTATRMYYKAKTFQTSYSLCSGERFAEQPTAAFCSGSLIGKNKVVTAGHCIKDESDCSQTRFVFDYKVSSKDKSPTYTSKSKVYSCKRIINTQLTGNGLDFAVVELDRDVLDREPVSLELGNSAAANDSVFVIGHPVGLPAKVTLGGVVRNSNGNYFVTNLDTYGGNSGSPVFNGITKKQVGILVRGEQDFTYSNGCYKSNRCTENGCRGEDVTHIKTVLDLTAEL